MKKFRSFALVLMCVAMVLSLAACHPKDEIAVTITDGKDSVSYTSAMYMYALMEADMAARTEIESKATDKEDIDYYSKKIDGKKFVDYVKDEALVNLKKFAAYEFEAKRLKLDEKDHNHDSSAMLQYYWDYYGYSQTYEPNGISFDTFSKAYGMLDEGNHIFTAIYGKGGEKEVAEKTVKDTMNKNYELADIISVDISEKKDAEVKTLKDKFQKYADRINKGETFEKIYLEYNNKKKEEETPADKDTLQPKDKYAQVIGSKETSNEDAKFDDIKKMKVGQAFVDTSDKDVLRLVVRGDLMGDPYHVDSLTNTVLWMLKETEYNEYIDGLIKDYKVDENKYATGQFKVKKIYYASTTAAQ